MRQWGVVAVFLFLSFEPCIASPLGTTVPDSNTASLAQVDQGVSLMDRFAVVGRALEFVRNHIVNLAQTSSGGPQSDGAGVELAVENLAERKSIASARIIHQVFQIVTCLVLLTIVLYWSNWFHWFCEVKGREELTLKKKLQGFTEVNDEFNSRRSRQYQAYQDNTAKAKITGRNNMMWREVGQDTSVSLLEISEGYGWSTPDDASKTVGICEQWFWISTFSLLMIVTVVGHIIMRLFFFQEEMSKLGVSEVNVA